MSPNPDLAVVLDILRRGSSLLLTTHVNPDGDAIGSMLALRCLLTDMGKERITCAMEDPVPRMYQWLPGAERIVGKAGVTGPYDVAVILDAARRSRIGSIAECIGEGTTLAALDHHLDEGPAEGVTFLDPTRSSVGEIIVELFDLATLPISPQAALCAYVALATDTGGFRFSNTSARSHRVAARLLETGIDVADVSERVLDSLSFSKLQLIARVLERLRLSESGRVAYSEVTAQDMQELGAQAEDLDGVVNLPRNLEGVRLAVLLREVDANTTKANFRARRGVNCANLARRFGGGGHAAAAGATLAMPLHVARTAVLQEACAAVQAAP